MSLLTLIVSSDRWFWVRINIYKVEKYIWGSRCWLHDAVCLVYAIFQTVVSTGEKQLTSVQEDEKVMTVAAAHLDSPSPSNDILRPQDSMSSLPKRSPGALY